MFGVGAVVVTLLLGLLLGILFVPRILRYFLAELGEASRANAKEKIQFSILDIYILIAQIALYSLPTALGGKQNVGLVQSMLIMAAYYTLCWVLAIRLLSRTQIRALWPRIVIMLLYPWMVTFALYYGIGAVSLIFAVFFLPLVPLIAVGVFVIAALFFRAVSRWVLTQRERPEMLARAVPYRPIEVSTANLQTTQTNAVSSKSNIDDDLQLQMPTGTDGR